MNEKEKFNHLFNYGASGGCIVRITLGEGKTKNGDYSHEGKIKVYLDDGRKVLAAPERIEIIGFYD